MPIPPLEISCTEATQLLAEDSAPLLIDCREPQEHAVVKLPGARLMPLGSIPAMLPELLKELAATPDPPRVIVYCHHGMRSAQAAAWLREHGLPEAQSLAGGIDAWAEQIDPSLPRY